MKISGAFIARNFQLAPRRVVAIALLNGSCIVTISSKDFLGCMM